MESKYAAELQAEVEGKSFEEKGKKRKATQSQKPQVDEDKAAQVMMLSKKKRWKYHRMMSGIKKQNQTNESLMAKRSQIEKNERKKKAKVKA